jgi:hypothetical protein
MKKNLKSITLVLITATALVFNFTACGGKKGDTADVGTAGETTESTSSTVVSAESYDVGDFTVDVPDNYCVVTLPDYSADADEDGNQPPHTDSIGLIQGGESEWDAFDKPTMYIYYYAETTAEEEFESASWLYSDIKEFDYSINGTDCIAMEGTLGSGESDEDPYEYYLIYVPITESDCINVILPKSVDGLSMDPEAEDVKAIIESVALK